MKVCVIGAGTMGAGISQAFASKGNTVIMCDVAEAFVEKGYKGIEKGLSKLVEKGRLEQSAMDATMANLSTTVDKKDAADCDLIVEAIVENMDIKKALFKELDELCKPETIFASNTSSLSITEMAGSVKRSTQVIGMHFFNPAPVMKLVEIIRGIQTSDETYAAIHKISQEIGKEPVEVTESPGFVVNRILVPMVNEAAGLLHEKVASAQDIDTSMKLGANHPMGPLALGDLIGLDVILAIMNVLQAETGEDKYRAHPLIKKMVRAGHLGRKSGKGFFDYSK